MQHPVGPSTPVRDFSPLGMWTTGGNMPTAGSRRLPPLFTTVNPPYIFWIYLTSFVTITILGMKEDDCPKSEQRTGEGEGDPSALSAW